MVDIEQIKAKYSGNTLYQLILGDEYNIYADSGGNIINVYTEVSNPGLTEKLKDCIKKIEANPNSGNKCETIDGVTRQTITVKKLGTTVIDERNRIFDTIIDDERDGTFKDSIGGKKSKKTKKMMKKRTTARKNKQKKGGYTPKNKQRIANQSNNNQILEKFQREITLVFFEILLMIKLFHWKTHSYATHKATDGLYSSFNENMDKFIEVLLGKSGTRIHLLNQTNLSLEEMDSQERLKQKIESFKSYLVGLDNNPAMKLMSNTDLLNIRDEILANMNQFLYLLTFK